MAHVAPFRAWKYDSANVGSLGNVTAPPYDVITEQDQKALYERHPCNVVRLILNRDEVGDSNTDDRYERAANFLRHWKSEGVLHQDREDSLYVYHQEFEWEGITYVRKGFLARLKLEPVGTGNVFPHEQTLPGPKKDRLALMQQTKTNLSPIFGLYPDRENEIQETLETVARLLTPTEIRDDQNTLHRLWTIEDVSAIARVREMMLDKPIFIADGHHRYETACKYREVLDEQSGGQIDGQNGVLENSPADYVMTMFVGMDDPGLAILPTHRIFSGLAPFSLSDLQQQLEPHFECETYSLADYQLQDVWEAIETDQSRSVLAFGIPGEDHWILARLKPDSQIMKELAPEHSENWQQLGVALLHQLVIDHLLKAYHQKDDLQWKYVHKMSDIEEAMQTGSSCSPASQSPTSQSPTSNSPSSSEDGSKHGLKHGLRHGLKHGVSLVCFVPAATIDDVQQIAEGRETMPPKSTFFYPKLLTGLVFHEID